MGRKLLADPHLPNKLKAGQADQVRPCIYCYTCVSAAYVRQPLRCAVNPKTGFEWVDKAATGRGKTYVVIGGGPGGMEAACQLAEAGNHVTLFEASDRLGGTLRFASLAYPANEKLLNWLKARVERAKVRVMLGTAVTSDHLAALKPEAVIVATGGRRDMPAIEGSDLPHVFSGDDMRSLMLGQSSESLKRKTNGFTRLATQIGAATGLTANLGLVRKVTHSWMPLGRKVVIIGGELVGIELAEFLHERGREVTVIEPGPHMGKGLMLVRRARILAELIEHGVPLHTKAADLSITASAVRFTDKDGQAQSIAADHVIVAMGATGDTGVADQMRALGYNVHVVGDANGIGYIEGAIRQANQTVEGLIA
jgi:NADPH-dependent 2,4-dienoyl-CoA reductase/sulfur reductase-like enzyme